MIIKSIFGDIQVSGEGQLQRLAWTGGSRPKDFAECSPGEQDLVHWLFNDQKGVYLTYWGLDTLPEDVRDTFWDRARYDAHATFRELTGNP